MTLRDRLLSFVGQHAMVMARGAHYTSSGERRAPPAPRDVRLTARPPGETLISRAYEDDQGDLRPD